MAIGELESAVTVQPTHLKNSPVNPTGSLLAVLIGEKGRAVSISIMYVVSVVVGAIVTVEVGGTTVVIVVVVRVVSSSGMGARCEIPTPGKPSHSGANSGVNSTFEGRYDAGANSGV